MAVEKKKERKDSKTNFECYHCYYCGGGGGGLRGCCCERRPQRQPRLTSPVTSLKEQYSDRRKWLQRACPFRRLNRANHWSKYSNSAGLNMAAATAVSIPVNNGMLKMPRRLAQSITKVKWRWHRTAVGPCSRFPFKQTGPNEKFIKVNIESWTTAAAGEKNHLQEQPKAGGTAAAGSKKSG